MPAQKKVAAIAVLLFIAFSLMPDSSSSDIGNYYIVPETGVISPKGNDFIKLHDVNVSIVVKSDGGNKMIDAVCTFLFENMTNRPVKVLMGFPIVTSRGLGRSSLSYFALRIGKADLPVVQARALPIEDWVAKNNKLDLFQYEFPAEDVNYTHIDQINEAGKGGELHDYITTYYWEYEFRANEKKSFTVAYQAGDWEHIRYIIETASLWKGCLPTMEIKISYPDKIPSHYISASPGDYYYGGDYLLWKFSNYCKENKSRMISADIIDDAWLRDTYDEDFYRPRFIKKEEGPASTLYLHYYPYVKDENQNERARVISPDTVVDQTSLLRNEIFARHGYIFKDTKYKNIFSSKEWYKPNKSFSPAQFNYIEKRNIEYLTCVEQQAKKIRRDIMPYFKKEALFSGILYYNCFEEGHYCPDSRYFDLEKAYFESIEGCYRSGGKTKTLPTPKRPPVGC